MKHKFSVSITYCPACNWLPRSTWMAQELLHTFADELEQVALRPSEVAGEFVIAAGDATVWDRRREGGFPDIKVLKQRVRDLIAPERHLGHLDRGQES